MEMPSSISSSEPTDTPRAARLSVLAAGLTGALVLLAVWELTLQQLDDIPRAALQPGRQAASVFLRPVGAGQSRVVMFGSSRVQNGFAPAIALKEIGAGYDARNSSLPMASSAHMLEAAAGEFRAGDIVICEVWPIGFYEDRSAPDFPEFADEFGADWALSRVERRISDQLATHMLAFSAKGDPVDHLRLKLRAGLVGGTPETLDATQARLVDHADGWREAVLTNLDIGHWKRIADAQVPVPSQLTPKQRMERFERTLARLRGVVAGLESRGVMVLFVLMPSSGGYRAMEESTFPRALYWERLSRLYPGRCLHFADDPELRDLWTPDGSHLETAGAQAFSRRIGKWIAGKLANPPLALDS